MAAARHERRLLASAPVRCSAPTCPRAPPACALTPCPPQTPRPTTAHTTRGPTPATGTTRPRRTPWTRPVAWGHWLQRTVAPPPPPPTRASHRPADPHVAPHPRQGRPQPAGDGLPWPTRRHGRGAPPPTRVRASSAQATAHTACLAGARRGHHLRGHTGMPQPWTPWRDRGLRARRRAADRVRAGRDARAPGPHRRAQARAMRRWARHATLRPGTRPGPDDRRCPGVTRGRDRRAHPCGPGSTRRRRGEAARTAARAGHTGSPTPRRPRVTRQTPATGTPRRSLTSRVPPTSATRSRTLAVSRRATDDVLEAQTTIGAVGSSALFGPAAPPRPVCTCPDAAPAADATPHTTSRPGLATGTPPLSAPGTALVVCGHRLPRAAAPYGKTTCHTTPTLGEPTVCWGGAALTDVPPREGCATSRGRLGLGWPGHRPHHLPGCSGAGPLPAQPPACPRDGCHAQAGPQPPGTAERRRPRAGMLRRQRVHTPPTGAGQGHETMGLACHPPTGHATRARRPAWPWCGARPRPAGTPGRTRQHPHASGEAARRVPRSGPPSVPTL